MTASATSAAPLRGLIGRRVALLAGVAGLGASVLFVNPTFLPKSNLATIGTPAYGQTMQAPVGFADIVDKVKPSVISVRVKTNAPRVAGFEGTSPFQQGSPMDRFFRRFGSPDDLSPNEPRGQRRNTTGQGSGFFISADGFAVTNNHVVDKAETVEIVMVDGRTYTAKVMGSDPRTDLALIKVEGPGNFPHVQLAERVPRIGDWVLAVGNPFGLGGTVTAGIVSARGRDIGAGAYDDFIQIDAPVNRGNSGGPTFDVEGNVIGVNTAIFSPSGGSVGIAFAIPADTVKAVITQLKDKGTVTRGWIGVQIQPVTADLADSLGLKTPQGALVAEPQSGGPADKAGIEAGDVITKVNNSPIQDARDLARQIGALAPGASVRLTILRKGAERTINLTLGELPNERGAGVAPASRTQPGGAEVPQLGLTLAPGPNGEGVVVSKVDPNGVAAEQGFKNGDVISEVGGKKVGSPADIQAALRNARQEGKRTVLMRLKSGDAMRYVALRLDRA